MQADAKLEDTMQLLLGEAGIAIDDMEKGKVGFNELLPHLLMVEELLDKWVLLISDRIKLLTQAYTKISATACKFYVRPLLTIQQVSISTAYERYHRFEKAWTTNHKKYVLRTLVDHASELLPTWDEETFKGLVPMLHRVYDIIQECGDNCTGTGMPKFLRDITRDARPRKHYMKWQLMCGLGQTPKIAVKWTAKLDICKAIAGSRHWMTCTKRMLLPGNHKNMDTCTNLGISVQLGGKVSKHCCCEPEAFYSYDLNRCVLKVRADGKLLVPQGRCGC
jgi:hypothetical protein